MAKAPTVAWTTSISVLLWMALLGSCRGQLCAFLCLMSPRWPPPPIPTLGQCTAASRIGFGCIATAATLVSAAARTFRYPMGPDASSDALRKNLRCKNCGHRGASLQHPSWIDVQIGWQPFPMLPKSNWGRRVRSAAGAPPGLVFRVRDISCDKYGTEHTERSFRCG